MKVTKAKKDLDEVIASRRKAVQSQMERERFKYASSRRALAFSQEQRRERKQRVFRRQVTKVVQLAEQKDWYAKESAREQVCRMKLKYFKDMKSLGELEQQEQQLLKEEYFEELAAIEGSGAAKIQKAKRIYFQKYRDRRISMELWEENVARAAAAEAGQKQRNRHPADALLQLEFGQNAMV